MNYGQRLIKSVGFIDSGASCSLFVGTNICLLIWWWNLALAQSLHIPDSTQWAAVSTCLELINVPPHSAISLPKFPKWLKIATCHGIE